MKKGVILKQNYLNEIIFRIDFETIPELIGENEEGINKFKNKIMASFPRTETIQQKSIDVTIKPDDLTSSMNKENLCWVFRNEENTKEISLTANNLILTYHKSVYSKFRYLLDDISLLLSAIKEYEINHIEFLGLRYINEINDTEINNNIQDYINPSLLNTNLLNDLQKENSDLIQIFSKLDFQQNNYILTLQYGFFNPTTDPNFEKHFILDYDCMNKQIINVDEVSDNLKNMHELIFNKFDYSVTNKFISKLGETYESN